MQSQQIPNPVAMMLSDIKRQLLLPKIGHKRRRNIVTRLPASY
jgi:hypothetical protein